MSHSHNERFPKGALIGAAGLITIAMLSALIGRLGGAESVVPKSTPLLVSDLRFEDRADGGIDVYDPTDKAPVDIIQSGSNAFVRATLRGLAQQRKREDKTDAVPFRFTAWADGRLTIDDSVTGRHVELVAFGQTNAEAFASLLEDVQRSKTADLSGRNGIVQ